MPRGRIILATIGAVLVAAFTTALLAQSRRAFPTIGGTYKSGQLLFEQRTFTHPESYGAARDGATDDKAAIAECLATAGRCELLPGTYYLSSSLTVDDDQELVGSGMGKTTLKVAAGVLDGVRLGTRARIADLRIQGSDEASSDAVEPNSNETDYLIERCDLVDFATGFRASTGQDRPTIRGGRIRSCTTSGITLGSGVVKGTTIDGVDLDGNATAVLVSGAIEGLRLTGCRVRNSTTRGVSLANGPHGILIAGNWFDSNTGQDITGASSAKGVEVTGNRCSNTPVCVDLASNSANWRISGNSFKPVGGLTRSISINSSADRVDIGPNYFEAGAFSYASHNASVTTRYLGQIYSNAAPASGTWSAGEVVWKTVPVPGQPMGWICESGGTPGTWAALPDIP